MGRIADANSQSGRSMGLIKVNSKAKVEGKLVSFYSCFLF